MAWLGSRSRLPCSRTRWRERSGRAGGTCRAGSCWSRAAGSWRGSCSGRSLGRSAGAGPSAGGRAPTRRLLPRQRVPHDLLGRRLARAAAGLLAGGGRAGRARAHADRHRLDAGHRVVATLDCTGGFFSKQDWRGIRVADLLIPAPEPAAITCRWSPSPATAGASPPATSFCSRPRRRPAALSPATAPRSGSSPRAAERTNGSSGSPGSRSATPPNSFAPASTIWSSFTNAGRGIDSEP